MNEEMKNYQEQVDAAFESNFETNDSLPLGKATPRGGYNDIFEDPEVKKMSETVGYIELMLGNLPSGGRFYADGFKIFIRAARVAEIRDYSMVDETDPVSVDDKLNSILSSCTRVRLGDTPATYKDILEEDRMYVIFSIRELTFKNGESKLMLPVSQKCPCGECQDSYELRTNNIQCFQPDEKIEPYYDEEIKSYRVQTKQYGEVILTPPNIGVMRALTEWARGKEKNKQKWDKSLLQIVPYLVRDWRGFDDKKIMAISQTIAGWDARKFSIVYRLIEMIKFSMKPEFTYICENCGGEVTVPVTFPGGFRDLFIISDIADELL